MVNNNVITIVSKANDKKLQDLPADITPYCRPGLNFIDFTSYPQEVWIYLQMLNRANSILITRVI